jgi:hypothetical protein
MSTAQLHEHFADKPDRVNAVHVVTFNLWGRLERTVKRFVDFECAELLASGAT